MLYIFWFLHQTTTLSHRCCDHPCCISFDSYIKPQLQMQLHLRWSSCISFDSYIKPQLLDIVRKFNLVVYLLIPTSNHNCVNTCALTCMLYIFWFLHQTTTIAQLLIFAACCISFDSYIKPQLAIAPNKRYKRCISFDSYIKPQLSNWVTGLDLSCISFDSYIKPQPMGNSISAAASCISFDSYIKPQRHL